MANNQIESPNCLDESIIIEIDDSPAIATRRSGKNSREKSTDEDSLKLCEYPVGKSDTVTVSAEDYSTLEHETFLNDIIIDFYLTYLKYEVLQSESRDSIHIFSTMFYKRLLQSPKKNAKKVPHYETDQNLTTAEKRHFRVAGWTKNLDLFSKDVVIIPICEHSHWYLVVVIKPGLINIPVESEERTVKGEPFVIVLDSLGGSKTSAIANIQQYLRCEWRKKKCAGEGDTEEFSFSSSEMRTVQLRKPEQENWSDCGIFLLHYVEKIFQNVDQFLWPSLPNLSNWFTLEEIGKKRAELAVLIRRLAKEQQLGKTHNFPKIKFSADSRASEAQKMDSSLKQQVSPTKDFNENLTLNEKCRSLRNKRYNSSNVSSARSASSKRDCPLKSSKAGASRSQNSSKEIEGSSSSPLEDFTFVPSKLLGTTTTISETSDISPIMTSVSSTATSDSMSFNSTNISTVASESSLTARMSSEDLAAATGSSKNFSEVWKACKNSLVIGEYGVSFGPGSKNDEKVRGKRHGLQTFKNLQLASSKDKCKPN